VKGEGNVGLKSPSNEDAKGGDNIYTCLKYASQMLALSTEAQTSIEQDFGSNDNSGRLGR
jgi:hypothetical protein